MYINPFPERFDLHVEITEKTDLNLLEEYLCNIINGRLFGITIVDRSKTSKEKLERIEQFCKAKGIIITPEIERNESKYFVGMDISMEYYEAYKDKCFVTENHAYIDENGGIFPCVVCKSVGPANTIQGIIEQKKKFEELNKKINEEDTEENRNNMKKFYESMEKTASEYMDKNINEGAVCKNCTKEYVKYNMLIKIINEYNNGFNIR